MDSALRPRDIQARIRAGESPEDVAAAAQTTVDAIMAFAGPVIAERQHVASTALKASLRRPAADSTSPRTLGEAAELFFEEHSLHDEDVEWDAWRRADGRWALVATYAVGGKPRTAEFTHDQPGRYVVADNDDARIFTGELRAPDQAGAPARPQARRLSSVHTQDELPLGDDAIELVRDPERAVVPDEVVDPTADTADADWLADPTPDARRRAAPGGAGRRRARGRAGGPARRRAGRRARRGARARTDEEPDDDPDSEDTVEVKQGSSRRKGRSSVPSWDEIMFGGSAKDE